MKQTLYLLLSLVMIATTAQAQLKVATNGYVGINQSNPLNNLHLTSPNSSCGFIVERTDASNYMNVLSGTQGSSLYFARAKRFSISPSSAITNTSPNVPNSIFAYGPDWSVTANAGNVGIGKDNPTEKLDINGRVKAAGFDVASDKRLKSNIEPMSYGLAEVLRLNPVSYRYNGLGGTENNGDRHFGLLAQELQQVAPEMVKEYTHVIYEHDEELGQEVVGTEQFLQIRDNEVKYMLLNAIKEQQAQIEAQNELIKQLQEKVATIESTGTTTVEHDRNVTLTAVDHSALEQNRPNPFESQTVIDYAIESDFNSAEIRFFNANGQLMHTEKINHSGQGQINLNTVNLTSGTYMYSLLVDGQVIDTKKMEIIK